jgi:hypothetical protein
MIITFVHDDIHQPRPWPVAVDEHNDVTSGLGPDDGARLIGFGPQSSETAVVYPDDVRGDPTLALGLVPSFSDGRGLFAWNLLVAEVSVRRTEPESAAPSRPAQAPQT